jgi:hypothetical protein
MKPKKLITKKLFYNKWPYKVTCIVKDSWRIKRLGVQNTINWCYEPIPKQYITGLSSRYAIKKEDKLNLLEFTHAIIPFLSEDIQLRVEGSILNLYCQDKLILDSAISKLEQWVTEVHEPLNSNECEFMINQTSKKIICNQLPHNQYRYRVWIKSSTSQDTRLKFKTWSENYGDKILPTRTSLNWMLNSGSYGWNPNIYVKDQPTLSMIGLFLGSNVRKVEEFIPRSSINITTDQEV